MINASDIVTSPFDMGDEDRRDTWYQATYQGTPYGLQPTREAAIREALNAINNEKENEL